MDPDQCPRVPADSSFFETAIIHLYRGEMTRMTVWRQRLDVSSNWAIVLTMALTTFTLGNLDIPHYVLLLGLALIGISIGIEGRRYRHLHHSKWRLYLMEFGFFADILHPASAENPDWRRVLARDLRHTHFALPWLTAVRVRLRRNYLILVYFVFAVWVVKLAIHPFIATSPAEFYARLSVSGVIPSWFVAITATGFFLTATLMALTCPPAEQLEDWSTHYLLKSARPD